MTIEFDINKPSHDNTVEYIDRNPYRLTYKVQSLTSDRIEVKHLDLPMSFRKESLFLAFVGYSKTQKFIQLATGTQYHYISTLRRLIDCFKVNKDVLKNKDDRALSVHFLVYQKDKLDRSADSIARDFNVIRMVLSYATDKFESFYGKGHYDEYLNDLKGQHPIIHPGDSTPQKTLTDVFTSNYSDDEVLISMRRVLVWFMKIMSDIRKNFLSENYELANEIFNAFDDGNLPYRNSVMTMADRSIGNAGIMKNNGYYTRSMLNLRSSIVNESMLFSQRHFGREANNGKRYSTWEIRRELEACFFDKASLRYIKKGTDRKDYIKSRYNSHIEKGRKFNGISQSVFPIGAMFTSTLAERRAIAWLAASDRIQASGLDGLKLDDVMLDGFDAQGNPNKIQIRFKKERAKRYFSTPIYQRGEDELFDVYYEFYLLRKNEEKYFSKVERPGYLMPSKWNKLYQRPAALCQSTHLPLLLLGLPGTVIYEACRAEVEKAEPFLEILQQSVKSSTKYRNSRSLNKFYGSEVDNCNRPISLEVITQTRAVMEDDVGDDGAVTAESSAHSPKTHSDIYIDRSDISKKTDAAIHTFGSVVGDKIYELAKAMGRLAKDEPDYNRARIMETLGLQSGTTKTLEGSEELNQIIEKAKSSGVGAGLIGDVNQSSETFIIQDSIIAAIIISYIGHLRRAKTKLEGKDIEMKLATSHEIYLESLLERFHRKHIREGRKLAKQLNLPYRSKI